MSSSSHSSDPLIQAARGALAGSWSPYSHFQVGAALETPDGTVFTGANVENSSYGLTICAERVAVFKAVTQGLRRFRRIALTCSTGRLLSPCGACRQVLAEFEPDLEILVLHDGDQVTTYRLAELLPHAFSRGDLEAGR